MDPDGGHDDTDEFGDCSIQNHQCFELNSGGEETVDETHHEDDVDDFVGVDCFADGDLEHLEKSDSMQRIEHTWMQS